MKNSKKFLLFAVIVTLLTLLFALCASAETVTGDCGKSTNDRVSWSFDTETGVLTISGTGATADYAAVADQPWSAYASSITSVEIADTVTSIGSRAFASLNKIKTCVVPDSVTTIGYGAFSACSSLESITIGNSVTEIGTYAFSTCRKLTEVHIPGSVATLQNYAFNGCEGLKSVTIEEGVQTISHGAFSGCSGLTEIVLPYSLKVFGNPDTTKTSDGVFKGCGNLKKVTFLSATVAIRTPSNSHIPAENAVIYGYEGSTAETYFTTVEKGVTFTKISSLVGGQLEGSTVTWSFDESTGTLTIGGSGNMPSCSSTYSNKQRPWDLYNVKKVVITKGITSVSHSAFRNIATIEEVILPEGITLIDQYAFKSCTGLTTINLPESLTKITFQAFNACSALKTITIPKNVTSFGKEAFNGCSRLGSVIFLADNDTSITFGAGLFTASSKVALYSNNNASVKALADQNANWISFDSITLEGYCDSTNKVHWAFNAKTGELVLSASEEKQSTPNYEANTQPWDSHVKFITSVSIDSNITKLGNRIFTGMTNLESIVIPDTVTSLGTHAFANCTSLENVTLGVGITSLGQFTFSGCTALESIVIPNSMTAIENSVFNNCTSLKNVVLNEGLLSISNKAFNNCTALESITIPSTVTTIGSSNAHPTPFTGCSALEEVVFLSRSNTVKMYPNDNTCIPAGVTIYYYPGSSAETYVTTYKNPGVEMTWDGILGSGTYEGFTWSLNEDGVLTIAGKGEMPTFKTAIEARHEPWYGLRSQITSVVAGEGITAISAYAFGSYTNLASVSLPSTLTGIKKYAFSSCTALTAITVPGGVAVGDGAFNNCSSLSSVTLEEGVVSITARSFNGCTSLKEIVLPASIEHVGTTSSTGSAFGGCTALSKVTVLNPKAKLLGSFPEGVTLVGFAGSTAEEACNSKGYTFAPLATDRVTIFEFSATLTPAESSEKSPLISFNRTNEAGTATVNLLYVDSATGKLYIQDAQNGTVYHELLNEEGVPFVLDSEATKIAIIYDNEAKTVRYYVDGILPTFGEEGKLAHSLSIYGLNAIGAKTDITADTFTLRDGVALLNAYRINESGTADYIGLQIKEDDEKKSTIRILAGLDTLYYGSVGFEVSLYADGVCQETINSLSKTVFSGVKAGSSVATAESFGYRYMTALTITGINRNDYAATSVYFVIRTFTDLGGTRFYGEEKQITITYNAEDMVHEYN